MRCSSNPIKNLSHKVSFSVLDHQKIDCHGGIYGFLGIDNAFCILEVQLNLAFAVLLASQEILLFTRQIQLPKFYYRYSIGGGSFSFTSSC